MTALTLAAFALGAVFLGFSIFLTRKAEAMFERALEQHKDTIALLQEHTESGDEAEV